METTSTLADDLPIRRATDLVATEVDGQVVILGIASGNYVQLNRVGSAVWRALEAPQTLAALCAGLRQHFDVAAAPCRSDVEAFVHKMRAQGLLLAG